MLGNLTLGVFVATLLIFLKSVSGDSAQEQASYRQNVVQGQNQQSFRPPKVIQSPSQQSYRPPNVVQSPSQQSYHTPTIVQSLNQKHSYRPNNNLNVVQQSQQNYIPPRIVAHRQQPKTGSLEETADPAHRSLNLNDKKLSEGDNNINIVSPSQISVNDGSSNKRPSLYPPDRHFPRRIIREELNDLSFPLGDQVSTEYLEEEYSRPQSSQSIFPPEVNFLPPPNPPEPIYLLEEYFSPPPNQPVQNFPLQENFLPLPNPPASIFPPEVNFPPSPNPPPPIYATQVPISPPTLDFSPPVPPNQVGPADDSKKDSPLESNKLIGVPGFGMEIPSGVSSATDCYNCALRLEYPGPNPSLMTYDFINLVVKTLQQLELLPVVGIIFTIIRNWFVWFMTFLKSFHGLSS